MFYAEIVDAVEKVKRRYRENDPFRLCRAMDIKLIFTSLGTEKDSIKGFFLESKRIRTITINSDLPSIIQKFVVSHELGHAVLHRKSGICAFHEVGLFDESDQFEKDANIFAAEYLLDDEAVLQMLNEDNTFFTAAASLCIPMELLDFKFRVLKWKGYKMVESPISARSNFLRDLEIQYCAEDSDC